MLKKIIYFPRWLWPNNLGDSMVFCAFPNIIKSIDPNIQLEIISDEAICNFLCEAKDVHSTKAPSILMRNVSHSYWIDAAFSKSNYLTENNTHAIYPENHPLLFKEIKNRFSDFVAHDSINFIVLNFALQLGISDQLFKMKNFYKFNHKSSFSFTNEKLKIGYSPMTKLNGKSSPHPGCNGLGFRFNGLKGEESWKSLLNHIKSKLNVDFIEFSFQNLGMLPFNSLYIEALKLDYAITNDGGYHHLFNLTNTPLTLFTGTKVTKPEFMQLGNAYVPDVHLECRKTCGSFYSEIFGVKDKSKTCKLECENIDPIKLGELIIKDIEDRVLCKKY